MAVMTTDQADAKLRELSSMIREIRTYLRPVFEARYEEVRQRSYDMIALSDAWFAENPDYPRDVPINAAWVSDLDHLVVLVRSLYNDVVGRRRMVVVGLGVAVAFAGAYALRRRRRFR